MSFEYQGTRHYAGVDPRAVNPVLVNLIRSLSPRRRPVLRIGGDSTDATWWPLPGASRPPWVKFTLTGTWIKTTRALARELGAHLILGINLAADSRVVAEAEARALVSGIGRRYVAALELGNEPEVYGRLPWYTKGGKPVYARPSWYGTVGLGSYARDVAEIRSALPPVPLAGPATGTRRGLSHLGELLSAAPGLGVVTLHRYPSNRCYPSSDSPVPATIGGLLSETASRGLMEGMAPYIALAHKHGAQFRVDELNTIACAGKLGVSNSFASALWAVDTLFSLARNGVDGVNVHTFPRAAYSLFLITHPGGHWQALVHPEYYGLLLFARAAPPGARLVGVRLARAGEIRAWATRAADGTIRVVLINDNTAFPRRVRVRVPGGRGAAKLERLEAPSASASAGVTLAGQSFGEATRTGILTGPRRAERLRASGGGYWVTLPSASAALITIAGG